MQDATHNPSEYEFDVTAERFFSQPPSGLESEDDDDWQLPPLSSFERLVMLMTVAPLVISIAAAITLLFFKGL